MFLTLSIVSFHLLVCLCYLYFIFILLCFFFFFPFVSVFPPFLFPFPLYFLSFFFFNFTLLLLFPPQFPLLSFSFLFSLFYLLIPSFRFCLLSPLSLRHSYGFSYSTLSIPFILPFYSFLLSFVFSLSSLPISPFLPVSTIYFYHFLFFFIHYLSLCLSLFNDFLFSSLPPFLSPPIPFLPSFLLPSPSPSSFPLQAG